MKERPILFSAPMVRAILEGRKTQTRRVVKISNPENAMRVEFSSTDFGVYRFDLYFPTHVRSETFPCPYGQPGDRLWVRETWRDGIYDGPIYRADACKVTDEQLEGTWKPSIFMPRWASRITLEITDVRVERLQEISEEDAKAEGVLRSGQTFRQSFNDLWGTIHAADGPNGWSADPWVWVIEFKQIAHTREKKG